ncbi:triose-phosphate isomerase [soil metagenome]
MQEMAPYWVGTSWKMNHTLAEAKAYAETLVKHDGARDPRIQRFIVPPYTAVRQVKEILAGSSVLVGAQNMHWEEAGGWTGEISARLLKECNVDFIEIGHSERRAHFGETDETVGFKVRTAIAYGFIPLICIGETLDEREAGRADEVLRAQLEGAFQFLGDQARSAGILVAYEPVWSIGERGIPATSDYVTEKHGKIKRWSSQLLPRTPPVLYGGSVNAENCTGLFAREGVDGLFIGRAAWTPEGYLEILRRCAPVK